MTTGQKFGYITIIFLQDVTFGHQVCIYLIRFFYTLKYILCNADLLSMLETVVLLNLFFITGDPFFSGFFD